jgi:hypothetical protein
MEVTISRRAQRRRSPSLLWCAGLHGVRLPFAPPAAGLKPVQEQTSALRRGLEFRCWRLDVVGQEPGRRIGRELVRQVGQGRVPTGLLPPEPALRKATPLRKTRRRPRRGRP